MKRKYWSTGLLLGVLVSIPIVSLMSLGDQLAGLPFVPVEVFDLNRSCHQSLLQSRLEAGRNLATRFSHPQQNLQRRIVGITMAWFAAIGRGHNRSARRQ